MKRIPRNKRFKYKTFHPWFHFKKNFNQDIINLSVAYKDAIYRLWDYRFTLLCEESFYEIFYLKWKK